MVPTTILGCTGNMDFVQAVLSHFIQSEPVKLKEECRRKTSRAQGEPARVSNANPMIPNILQNLVSMPNTFYLKIQVR